ncbi:MAG: nuclear transport factor 2 family protein [Actinomycetota bacterium]
MKAIEAFNRSDIPGALRFMDPEIQFAYRLAALQGEYAGLDGVRGFLADVAEHFETWQIHCPDVRDLGDRVLALGTIRATGKGSGAETELPFTVVARFRDGRITHFTDFGDKAQALEAAGLRE